MKFAPILILAAAVASGAHLWNEHRQRASFEAPDVYARGEFVAAAMPREARRNTVLIVAPENCPRNAARFRKTQALAQRLSRMGVPNETVTNISFLMDQRDADARRANDRTMAVLNDGPPIVFLNGMAKANPSPDEVAAEFDRTRG